MQICADVIGCTLQVAASSRARALRAAVAASVAAGAPRDFAAAPRAMTSLKPRVCRPRAAARRVYDTLHGLYRRLLRPTRQGGIPSRPRLPAQRGRAAKRRVW